jgi:hypothetical protein
MNQIKEILNIKKASCREMYLPDLWYALKYNRNIYWSWGVNEEKTITDKPDNPKMLRIKVSGHLHKGYVYIFLNGLDLFDVYLTNKEDVIKDRTPEMGIYVFDLENWIDEKIERIPEHKD